MAFEIEMFNGTFNTGHILLHSMNDTADYQQQQQTIINTGGIGYASGTVPYKPYAEWVYWSASKPPNAEEAARCAAAVNGLTSGPYRLPDGSSLCFVTDKCAGPFQGAFQFAFSSDGHELEIGTPFASFLHLQATGKPALGIDSVVNVQFTLETSRELSIPLDWCSDGTESFVYHFGRAATLPPGVLLAIGIFSGIAIGSIGSVGIAYLLWRRHKRKEYNTL
jgi:hypothetical protein